MRCYGMQFSDFSMSEWLPDFECEGLEQSLGRPLTSNSDVVCLSVLFFFFSPTGMQVVYRVWGCERSRGVGVPECKSEVELSEAGGERMGTYFPLLPPVFFLFPILR